MKIAKIAGNMKFLKLILIFVIILGGVVLAFTLLPDADSGKDVNKLSADTMKKYYDKVTQEWETAGDWNDSLFLSHCNLVEQLSRQYAHTEALQDLVTETSTHICYRKVMEEWSRENCREDVVDKYMKAFDCIRKKDRKANYNKELMNALDINATYREALQLARATFGLRPNFNGETWQSFANYGNRILDQRDRILSHPNYVNHLSGITEIKNGLETIPDRLWEPRGRFYATLAHQICSHFKKNPTAETLRRLRLVYGRLRSENPGKPTMAQVKEVLTWCEQQVENATVNR